MLEETNAGGAGAGAGGGADGGGSSSPGVGGTSMSEAQISAPGGDMAFLNAEPSAPKETPAATTDTDAQETKPIEGAAKEEGAPEEIDLSKLEEGQPEWLAKVTDPAVKTEVQKLLDLQKAFTGKFKDAADLDAFFKDLPGGREQVAAMQTLSKEIAEQDTAIESNTPEGNAMIAEKYLSMTPDAGVGMVRAIAQHMAKASPEAWNQIATELVNSTLNGAGIGADIQAVTGAIADMRAAIAADDGEAFGKAAGKLLGTPKEAPKQDANLAKMTEREQAARAGEQKAQQESWQFRSEKSGDKVTNHLASEIGKRLSKILPASISEQDRTSLRVNIAGEVMSQLTSNAWLASQVRELIGWSSGHGTPKGPDYSGANLRAGQAEFDKASQLIMDHATSDMIVKAVSTVVSKWSRERAAGNKDARDKAKKSASTVDAGAGKAAGSAGAKKALDATALRARNADGSYVISDQDFLNS